MGFLCSFHPQIHTWDCVTHTRSILGVGIDALTWKRCMEHILMATSFPKSCSELLQNKPQALQHWQRPLLTLFLKKLLLFNPGINNKSMKENKGWNSSSSLSGCKEAPVPGDSEALECTQACSREFYIRQWLFWEGEELRERKKLLHYSLPKAMPDIALQGCSWAFPGQGVLTCRLGW